MEKIISENRLIIDLVKIHYPGIDFQIIDYHKSKEVGYLNSKDSNVSDILNISLVKSEIICEIYWEDGNEIEYDLSVIGSEGKAYLYMQRRAYLLNLETPDELTTKKLEVDMDTLTKVLEDPLSELSRLIYDLREEEWWEFHRGFPNRLERIIRPSVSGFTHFDYEDYPQVEG